MRGHIRELPSGRFQARYPKGKRGKFTTKSHDTYEEAEKWLRDQDYRYDRGDWLDPKRSQEFFDSVADAFLKSRRSLRETTRARDESVMKNLVLPHLGDFQLRDISTEVLIDWITTLDEFEEKAPATVTKAYHLAAGVLDYAVETNRIGRNPARLPSVKRSLPKIEKLRKMRILDVDEIAELADAIDPRFRALVLLAGHTGMRWGEIVGLKAKFLDLNDRTISVAGTLAEVAGRVTYQPFSAKNNSSRRVVAISKMLAGVLRDHLAEHPAVGNAFIFTAPEGGELRRTHFRNRYWLPAVKSSVGLPLVFHDLRHSHASILAKNKVHPKVVADRLGHKSTQMTMDTYSHAFAGMDEEVADLLDDLTGGDRKHGRSTQSERKVSDIRP